MLDVWDDTDTGPRWRYVLLVRPLLAAAPSASAADEDQDEDWD